MMSKHITQSQAYWLTYEVTCLKSILLNNAHAKYSANISYHYLIKSF